MNRVVYKPPSEDVVNRFVRAACLRLAQEDARYNDPEVVNGFSRFLSVVGEVMARNLNRETGQVDNANE